MGLSRVLPRSGFGRGVALLAGSSAAAQLIGLAASPFLTRLYAPAGFGVAAQFTAVLGITSTIACLRYELAVPLPEDDADGMSLVVLSSLIAVALSIVIGATAYAFRDGVAQALSTPALASYLWVLGPAILLAALYQALSCWAMREKGFGALAGTRITQGAGAAVVQLAAGAAGLDPGGLIAGQVVGQGAGAGQLVRTALPAWRKLRPALTAARVRAAASRYRRFPLFSTWDGLIFATSLQLPVLLLSSISGSAAAGYYALSFRIVQLPVNLLGTAVAQVFYPDAARSRSSPDLSRLTATVFTALWRLALPLGLVLIACGPELFSFVFGARWETAGVYTQWLAPLMVLTLVAVPLASLTLVRERQSQNLVFQALMLAARAAALAVGSALGGALGAVATLGCVSAALYAVYVVWCLRLADVRAAAVASPLLRGTLYALAVAAPALVLRLVGVGDRRPLAPGGRRRGQPGAVGVGVLRAGAWPGARRAAPRLPRVAPRCLPASLTGRQTQ